MIPRLEWSLYDAHHFMDAAEFMNNNKHSRCNIVVPMLDNVMLQTCVVKCF